MHGPLNVKFDLKRLKIHLVRLTLMILQLHLIANLDNGMKLQELVNEGLPAHA
jgi:hypothetical protein